MHRHHPASALAALKREVSPIAIFSAAAAVDLINRQCDSFVAESENQLSLKPSALEIPQQGGFILKLLRH